MVRKPNKLIDRLDQNMFMYYDDFKKTLSGDQNIANPDTTINK